MCVFVSVFDTYHASTMRAISLLLVFFYTYFNPFCVAMLKRMRYIGIDLSVWQTVRPFGGPSVGSSRKLNVRIGFFNIS